jgi:hypothetical protein
MYVSHTQCDWTRQPTPCSIGILPSGSTRHRGGVNTCDIGTFSIRRRTAEKLSSLGCASDLGIDAKRRFIRRHGGMRFCCRL